MLPFPLAESGWSSDDAALDAAPDPRDLPAVISFSCLSQSLILWSCCCICALNGTTSDFKLVICPAGIPICPWIPSSRGARAPLIAALDRCHGVTRSVHHNEGGECCRSVCLLTQIFCTVVFSNPSSFQHSQLLVFGSRVLQFATGPVQILALLLGSPHLGPEGANPGSPSAGEQDTFRLAVPLPPPLFPT